MTAEPARVEQWTSATPPAPTSPWRTSTEAATYARCSKRKVIVALGDYVRSGGKRGLRGSQSGPNCKWAIHVDDLEAWMAGQRPGRKRTLRVAS